MADPEAPVVAELDGIALRARNLQSFYAAAGGALVSDAQLCFRESRTPWGEAWAPLRPVTIARRRAGSSQPLMDTGVLRNSITYVVDEGGVTVGTNLFKAGTLHFGATKGAYGKTARGAPIPWGDIPARQFLPIRTVGGEVELPQAVRDEIDMLATKYLIDG